MPSNLTSLFYFEVNIFTPLPRKKQRSKEDNGFAKIMKLLIESEFKLIYLSLPNICWSKGNKANFFK